MAEAYKLKRDASIPRAIREVEELAGGEVLYETEGINYREGDYVLAEEISPPIRERIENGELDSVLEEASKDDALAARRAGEQQARFGLFTPEHETEAEALESYGHETISRDVAIEQNAAGADAAKEALEAGKEDGRDKRPNLTSPEVPSLAEASKEGKTVTPKRGRGKKAKAAEKEEKEAASAKDAEQPSGAPTGKTKAAAEGADKK